MSKQSQGHTQTLIGKLASLGVWRYDVQKDHLIWDDQMFKIFGIDPEKFQNRFSDWRNCVHPEDVEGAEEAFLKSVESGGEFVYSFRIILPNGKIRMIKANAIKESNDSSVIIGANQDITEIFRADQEKQELMETLRDSQETARIGSW